MNRLDYFTVLLLLLGTLLTLVDMLFTEGNMRGSGVFMGFILYIGTGFMNGIGRS